MIQLDFQGTRREIDIDGYIDRKGIRYLGKAVQVFDGTWRCLADVNGCLCRVEVSLKDAQGNAL